ncbi:MAG: mechanosensitive ion channel protein MscS, partial [Nanohaloarchaea archaeon QH_8_44_6]
VLDHPKPRVRFQEFGDYSLKYELFTWIPKPIERIRARHKINRSVFKKFKEEGVEIPYPQSVLHQAHLMEKGQKDLKDSEPEDQVDNPN